jgi:hypothetical protein
MPDMAKMSVRVDDGDLALFDRIAAELGVETSGLFRLAALEGLQRARGEVSAGRVRLRRRSGVPVSPGVVVERPAGVVDSVPAAPAVSGLGEASGDLSPRPASPRARLSRAEAFRAATSRPSGG